MKQAKGSLLICLPALLLLPAAQVFGQASSVEKGVRIYAPPPSKTTAKKPEAPAPAGPTSPAADDALEVLTLRGERLRFPSLLRDGQPAVVIFWTTWCGFCREELTHIKELAAAYQGQGLQVFAFNTEDPDELGDKVREYASQRQLNFPVFFASAGLCRQLNGGAPCDSVPRTMVYGRDQRLLYRFKGYDRYDKLPLDNAVRRALAR